MKLFKNVLFYTFNWLIPNKKLPFSSFYFDNYKFDIGYKLFFKLKYYYLHHF